MDNSSSLTYSAKSSCIYDICKLSTGKMCIRDRNEITQAGGKAVGVQCNVADAAECEAFINNIISEMCIRDRYVTASVGDVTPLNTETLQALMNGLAALPTQIQTIVDNANGLLGTCLLYTSSWKTWN